MINSSKKFNKTRRFVVALVLIAAAAFCFCFAGCYGASCAQSEESPFDQTQIDYYSYTIKSINAVVTVREDSTVRFNEKITVDFHVPKLGIYRDLATNSGESYRDIKIIKSEWNDIEHEDGFVRISLGKPDGERKVTGVQEYEIEYTLILPDRDNPDDIYLNLIGFGWTTKIEQASIELYTPEKLGSRSFFTQYGGASPSDKVVDNNDDPVKTEKGYRYDFSVYNLYAFQGVTIKSSLPEGTIKLHEKSFPILQAVACFFFVAAGILLLFYSQRGQEVTEITHYYPPEINGRKIIPPEAGLYIDGTLSPKDVASIIFYWANNGYIRIDQADKNDPVLVKLREISAFEAGGAEYLRLFDAIFKCGDEVKVSSLQYKLTASFSEITAKSRATSSKFYNGKSIALSVITAVSALIVTAVIAALTGIATIGSADVTITFIPLAIVCVLGYVANMTLFRYRYKMKGYKFAAIGITLGATAIGALSAFAVFGDVMPLYASMPLSTGTAFLAAACGLSYKRTQTYIQALGDILGFKNFLEVAEKEKLEMLLEENPQYYYDILPYANVLGVSDKWENKFKDITVQPPEYVSGGANLIDLYVYSSIMRSLNSNMCAAMSPKPSSSSKSGFGGFGGGGFGGGFGGGGFGGGGGGAR